MADPIIIQTQQDAQEPIEFRINDEPFKWTPVHTGGLLVSLRAFAADEDEGPLPREAMAAVGMVNEILYEGIDPSERPRLDKVLRFVEITDIMALIEGLLEVVTARPTRSDSG